MNLNSLKKKSKELGLAGCGRYYCSRAVSKISAVLVGGFARRFCRVHSRRLVFKNREMQDFTDNARAFFEFLIEKGYNENYEIIWLVSEKKKFRHMNLKNVKFVTAESRYGWNSPLAYYYGATAGYFFYTNNNAGLNLRHCEGQKAVNLWHGCGYKGAAEHGGAQPMVRFDYALVPGPVFVKTKSAYWDCPKEKILPLGYPRYDWMLSADNDREAMMKRLFGTEIPYTKTVMWMPTFRKNNLSGYGENEIELPFDLPAVNGPEEMQLLDAFCREKEILLIIKKHPLQTEWSSRQENYTNIRFITEKELDKAEVQLYRLVGVCDGLLSDYSSIAVDYLLLNRPLGFVLTDVEMYREKRGFVFADPMKYMPGEKIYDFRELKDFLEHVAEGKDLFAKERQRLMPEMHNPTSDYCERIAQYLNIRREYQWEK